MAEDIYTIRVSVYGMPAPELERVVAAGAGFTPGMLLEIDSSGLFQYHSTSDKGGKPSIIAVENYLLGKTISDPYIAGEIAVACVGRSGDVFQMIPSISTTIGDRLTSNGDGRLKAGGIGDDGAIIGVALEAVGPNELCKVMIA